MNALICKYLARHGSYFILALACLAGQPLMADDASPVRIAEESLVIPTYPLGPADPHPLFYMNESYQGAQKRIYPYALQDHLVHDRIDTSYTVPTLENDFVRLGVLPDLGGRWFTAADGKELIAYQPVHREAVTKLPEPVKAPPKPEEIKSIEELYLTGLRVEQIHNPRVDPLVYYEEALRRDPGDSRSNMMVGIHDNQRALYGEAEQHLRKAVERLTLDYTRSRTGEAHFHLGVSLLAQQRDDEAYEQFYRATWDQAFHTAACYELAAISCRRGDFAQAASHVAQAITTNSLDTKALNLQAAILRSLGRPAEAAQVAAHVSEVDPLDFWARNELRLAQTAQGQHPLRLETIDVLKAALVVHPDDAHAEYFLGNLLFDLQPDTAIEHWERSRSLDKSLAVVHRNLGWAYYRVKNDVPKAITSYEQALSCEQLEPRLLLELDQLYEHANVAPERRLAVLQVHHAVVVRREDSFLREIMRQVLVGQYPQALENLTKNFFHAIAYCVDLACEALGDLERAKKSFAQSAAQRETREWPAARYYQALSLAKLGDRAGADKVYDELVNDGQRRLKDEGSADFFAKFGQEQSRRSQLATAHYLLGLLGKGNQTEATKELEQAVQMNQGHAWARYQLDTVRP